MANMTPRKTPQKKPGNAAARYAIGFALSIVFTLGAYLMAQIHIASGHAVISHGILAPAILGFALAQLLAQLFFFLHMGDRRGPGGRLAVFLVTAGFVILIVLGSLWIMDHLNRNMTSGQMEQYIHDHQGGM